MIIPLCNHELASKLIKKLQEPILKENGFAHLLHLSQSSQIEPEHFSIILSDSATSKFFEVNKEKQLAIASIASSLDPLLIESAKNQKLTPKNLMFLGINTWDKDNFMHSSQLHLKVYTAKEMSIEGIHEVSEAAMTSLRELKLPIFVSINLNVLEKIYLKNGCIGGFTPRELLFLVQRFKLLKNLNAVELLNIDDSPYGLELAVKLIRELS